jgi:hypothetical protein
MASTSKTQHKVYDALNSRRAGPWYMEDATQKSIHKDKLVNALHFCQLTI